jgi:hypothetical protein
MPEINYLNVYHPSVLENKPGKNPQKDAVVFFYCLVSNQEKMKFLKRKT